MVKIFIVDDEPMIIEVLQAYLEREGFIVYSANNGAEGLRKIKEVNPDLIILDLMLPDMTGEEICTHIRYESNVPIIMLTAKTDEEDRIRGIVIGADDYIVKPFSPREVVVRVQAILRRVGVKNHERLSFNDGELVINNVGKTVYLRGRALALTPIEFKLLYGIATYPGRVYSRLELLDKAEIDPYVGYERNIDVHIKNLRKKMEDESKKPKYIITVFGMGYKFGGKPDVSYTTK